jgi:hypothetical protein
VRQMTKPCNHATGQMVRHKAKGQDGGTVCRRTKCNASKAGGKGAARGPRARHPIQGCSRCIRRAGKQARKARETQATDANHPRTRNSAACHCLHRALKPQDNNCPGQVGTSSRAEGHKHHHHHKANKLKRPTTQRAGAHQPSRLDTADLQWEHPGYVRILLST